MLRNFRQVFKGNQTPMAVVMFVVLLGLVAYLAPQSGNSESSEFVLGRVYGRDIVKRDLDRQISEQIKEMTRTMGRQQVDMDRMMPYLQTQAMNSLVRERILDEMVERHHVVITAEEVQAALEARLRSNGKVFLTDGGQLKSVAEITEILRANDMNLMDWEREVRQGLSRQKLLSQASALVPVDGAWMDRENRLRNEKVAFQSLSLAPEMGPVADPGDAALSTFLKQAGARFQVAPRRVVQFVVVDQATFGKTLDMDDAALKQLFDARRKQFEELRASHILFKAEGDSAVQVAMGKATALRAKLVAGGDFAAAAEESSEDPTAKGKGGSLGWFGPGTMVKPFHDAAAALQVGEISQPVRTPFGVHLIRLEERRDQTFEAVKETLRAQVTRERFDPKAKELLEQLRKRVGDRGELGAAARNLKLTVQTSQPFLDEPSATIQGLPGGESLVKEAFRLKVGQVSRTEKLGDKYAVFRVQEERPRAVPPLAEIRSKVLDAWKLEEARRQLATKAAAALKGGNLEALGLPAIHDAATLDSLGELGKHPGIRAALLDTPEGQITPCLWGPDGKLWVARIQSRTPAPALTFETRRTLLHGIQNEVAEKLLVAEMGYLDKRGRMRSGFSSLKGRLDGIWLDKEALRRMAGESAPDLGGDDMGD